MTTTSVTLVNPVRSIHADLIGLDAEKGGGKKPLIPASKELLELRRPVESRLNLATHTPVNFFSFATLILLGSLAMPVASQADPLLLGEVSTLVRARFGTGSSDLTSSDGGSVTMLSGAYSYVASETRDDYFVASTGATQISNNDGADVAKISFTGAMNVFAQSYETDSAYTTTQMGSHFSVTAPVTYLIQGDFKGELLQGAIGASSLDTLSDYTFTPQSDAYLEEEVSESAGVFHHLTNLSNDGVASRFVGLGSLTGLLMPGHDYFLGESYSLSEGFSLANASAFGLGNYSITFTRVTDDGTGGGNGGGGGTSTVPDSGSSAGLFSLGMLALAVIRRRC